MAIRFERGLDARFFVGRQRRRLVFDSLDVPARRELPELAGTSLPFQVKIRARRGMSRFYSRITAERLRSLPAVLLRGPPNRVRA